jgi:hypothetical protein
MLAISWFLLFGLAQVVLNSGVISNDGRNGQNFQLEQKDFILIREWAAKIFSRGWKII